MNGHAMIVNGGHSFGQLDFLPDVARQNIQAYYARNFPYLKERSALHQWIDSQWPTWQTLDPNNLEHINYVNSLIPSLHNLVKEHEMKGLHGDQLKVRDAVLVLSQTFEQQPWELVHALNNCLRYEMEMVRKAQNKEPILSLIDEEHQNINRRLDEIMTRNVALRDLRTAIQTTVEEFNSLYPEFSKLKVYIERNSDKPAEQVQKWRTDKAQLECRLVAKHETIATERSKFFQEVDVILQQLGSEQMVVIEELKNWRRGQQLFGNGGIHDGNLDLIQSWFEFLAKILWDVKVTVDLFLGDYQRLPTKGPAYLDIIPAVQNRTQGLLYQLIRQSFVIEKQPPQVMKTSTRFSTVIRLLIGANLGIGTAPPHIKASIVSEAFAKELIHKAHLQEHDIPAKDNCGTLVNNTATMEHNAQSRTLTANFRAMQLNKIKRTEKKGSECVMDEKFAIAFQSQIRIAELVFPVFALSLPVVAIVHGNQEPHAWATVTWDNAFAPPERLPFVVPEKMYWNEVGELLSMKFRQYVGRNLTSEALSFLAFKACRTSNNNYGKDFKQQNLSWSFFAKEPLPDRNFTFWEWFYAILKVAQQHLSPLWKEGAILGFVEKKSSEEMISRCPPGTFLLRFSDSELGGVSITFVSQVDDNPPEVFMTSPFTSKDLSIRGLADRIKDLKNLTHLWTSSGLIPKDQKFAKHYSPPQPDRPTSNGYVKPELACTLPGKMSNMSITDSQPNTPISYVASSPQSNDLSYMHESSQHSNGYGEYMNPQDSLRGVSPSASAIDDQILTQSQIDDLIDSDVLAGILDEYIPDGNIEDYDDSYQMTP